MKELTARDYRNLLEMLKAVRIPVSAAPMVTELMAKLEGNAKALETASNSPCGAGSAAEYPARTPEPA